jgi:hypothetical protein
MSNKQLAQYGANLPIPQPQYQIVYIEGKPYHLVGNQLIPIGGSQSKDDKDKKSKLKVVGGVAKVFGALALGTVIGTVGWWGIKNEVLGAGQGLPEYIYELTGIDFFAIPDEVPGVTSDEQFDDSTNLIDKGDNNGSQ